MGTLSVKAKELWKGSYEGAREGQEEGKSGRKTSQLYCTPAKDHHGQCSDFHRCLQPLFLFFATDTGKAEEWNIQTETTEEQAATGEHGKIFGNHVSKISRWSF